MTVTSGKIIQKGTLFMTTPDIIHQLVKRFDEHKEAYRSGKYNETQLRREFLDPFFEALGWDVFNKQSYAEIYKDVIHEDSLEIEGENKAPDYAFRIGGQRKFFVEAKKPAVKIETDIHPAFQLRRYAWSAKLPLSILSDFEELAIYDCRAKPDKKDKASAGRVKLYSYKDYVEKWDEIASIFSREAVLKGSFDAFAEGTRLKKGTAEVDDAFLAEIERWRDLLATNIAIKNQALSVRELNYAVQMTIDRIVFLRICEDRGVERDEQLKEIGANTNVYENLCLLFKRADARYNSGLFHFSEEKDASSPTDTLTLNITVDDKPLKDIIKNLYYPESPYVFREIPADILGQVYERFLGKVIRLTASHRAKVEEKPEVRKAGGVYYTPTYIVEYIVENTVGKLLEGKTPKEAEKIRVLDSACGSGTFPLGAYQYLLDWHLKWYMDNDPEKWATGKKPVIFQSKDGYRLTTSKKKDILLNNIYGVDIDPQAVEVTKLSLLLKVLEGESHETIGSQLAMFQERVLPDLGKNIKCGNSLIGNDYYEVPLRGEGQQLTMLVDEEERYRVNAFDWKAEFSQVFIQGGFDAVIGNPPYAYRNATEDLPRDYYLKKYESAEGNFELYKFFIENNLNVAKENGYTGIIVSATFLVQPSFHKLRNLLLSKSEIVELSPLGPGVFEDATVDTTILISRKASPKDTHSTIIKAPIKPKELRDTASYAIRQKRFISNDSLVFDYKLSDESANIVQKMFDGRPTLEAGFEFGVGINTGFIKEELVADEKIDIRYHPMIAGTGISRYGVPVTKGWIMYDKEFVKSKGKLGRTLPAEILLSSEKILVVRTRNLSLKRRIVATIDGEGGYNLNRLSNIIARPNYSIFGLLGLLNSNLFNWLFSTRYFDYEIKPVYLRSCPLANVKNANLISLVERMLALHKQSPRTPQEQEMVKREIESTDRGIDGLVYELYGLSEEEIRIVEGD